MNVDEPKPVVERPASRGYVLAGITLIWMAAMLWSARVSITGQSDVEVVVTSTAYALPGAVSAALVAGASLALALTGRFARTASSTVRFAVATGAGLVLGVLGALAVVTISTEGWLYATVGGTVAAAATIGGALAGFRVPRVIHAICWAALGVFAVGFVLNLFQNPILNALGSGDSQSSRANAATAFSYVQSALSGVTAAIVGYRLLRRARRQDDGADVPWPFYALAGGGPGLLLLVAEVLNRTAGARVLALAGKVSPLETTIQSWLSTSRLNNALIVLFVGAIASMIAIGRTIGPKQDEAEPVAPPKQAPPKQAGPRPTSTKQAGTKPDRREDGADAAWVETETESEAAEKA